jgi:hypothetical protein
MHDWPHQRHRPASTIDYRQLVAGYSSPAGRQPAAHPDNGASIQHFLGHVAEIVAA